MSSAISSAYVLLGKATLSDPPDWSTAVGAIHSLSSLLTCSICNGIVGPHPHATPNDSYSLVCDKCDVKPIDQDCPELLKLLMDNIRNLCSYALNTYKHVPKLEEESSDEEDMKDDILVVPTQSSQAKFVSKLRKFSKVYFHLEQEIFPLKRPVTVTSVRTQPASLLSSPPKAVIVTSPAKPTLSNGSGQSRPGQWIKVHHSKPATTTTKRSNSLIKINGNKFGRDQIVKTTLRPSLNFPFKHQTTATTTTSLKLNDLNNKLNDFVVKLDEIPTKVLQATATSTPPGELQDNGRGKKGCRCGNATPAPGKLTCGGQRCPCYVGSRSCIDCKCKGCRNPHQINGIKVIRPHLQVKSLANSNNSQNTTTTNQKPQGQSKFYIATAPLVSPKSNSMTTIRRIHLN